MVSQSCGILAKR